MGRRGGIVFNGPKSYDPETNPEPANTWYPRKCNFENPMNYNPLCSPWLRGWPGYQTGVIDFIEIIESPTKKSTNNLTRRRRTIIVNKDMSNYTAFVIHRSRYNCCYHMRMIWGNVFTSRNAASRRSVPFLCTHANSNIICCSWCVINELVTAVITIWYCDIYRYVNLYSSS